MNIALVYDRINKYGGAERVLENLHTLYPNSPVYTSVYNQKTAPWANGWDIRPTFLSRIPLARSHHELLPLLTPFAFETLSFDGFDAVISVTSADAKAILTKPETCHICYCLTPTRYLWSGYEDYTAIPGLGIFSALGKRVFLANSTRLRRWDLTFSKRPDYYTAISNLVAQRISRYYGIPVDRVIYPPVDTDTFIPAGNGDSGYFLTVGRLVPYKRIDTVVEAVNRLGVRLVVIGSGRDEARIRKLAGPTVTLITEKLTDEKLASYYQHCRAFVFAGAEDFGITAAEAQSCGKPVVCFGGSGMAEIVKDRETGVVLEDQSVESVMNGMKIVSEMTISPDTCRSNALRFGKKRFADEFREYIVQTVDRYRKALP